MLKQPFHIRKNALTILVVFLVVISMTAVAVNAAPHHDGHHKGGHHSGHHGKHGGHGGQLDIKFIWPIGVKPLIGVCSR